MNTNGLRALWKQAFGDTDAFLDGFFSAGFSEDRCCTIDKGGKLAAMLYWFDCHWDGRKIAYLYAVATDKDYRNQGLCRALMEHTHNHLRSLGYAGAVLVPGSRELFSLYEKLGYQPFGGMDTVTEDAINLPVAIRPVTPAAYCEKRLSFLPKGSVVQDAATYAFLATFCSLFESHDGLFCGGMEEDTFYFQEFLGDPKNVPGILRALGAKKGVFRTPGNTPFAMYHPLNGAEEIPNHFDIPLN